MNSGNQAIACVIAAFEKLGIDYLLAGSLSSNLYGIPRSTTGVACMTPALCSMRSAPPSRRLIEQIAPYLLDNALI